MAHLFDRVAILGVGLLGASLGLALRQKKTPLAGHVVGLGRARSSSLACALEMGALDSATSDAAQAVAGADLVILATPLRQFPELLKAISPALEAGTLVTDVGSTKQQVEKWAAEFLPRGVEFIGSHPMAGSEKRGPEAARADLFSQALCLICPPAGVSAVALERLEQFWQALGMRLERLSAQEHDRRVAAISHLPHAVAAALVHTAAEVPGALGAAAGGFCDTTRVASGDVQVWTDIFLTNAPAAVEMLTRFEQQLAVLRQAIAGGQEAEIAAFLELARQTRQGWLNTRTGS